MNELNGEDLVDEVLAAQGSGDELPSVAERPAAGTQGLGTAIRNNQAAQDHVVGVNYQAPVHHNQPSGAAFSNGDVDDHTNVIIHPTSLAQAAHVPSSPGNATFKPEVHVYTEEEEEEKHEEKEQRHRQNATGGDGIAYRAPHGTYSLNPSSAALIPANEDEDSIPELTLTTIQRKHHLLRHSLPDDASGVNALPHFGASTIDEATAMIQGMSQRELQAMFQGVYNVRSQSNNNNWLRKKLLEAIHPKALSSEINRMAGISDSVTARKRSREGPDYGAPYRPRKTSALGGPDTEGVEAYQDMPAPRVSDLRGGGAGSERPPEQQQQPQRPRRRAAAGVAAATAAVLRDPELEALEKYDMRLKIARDKYRPSGTWPVEEDPYNRVPPPGGRSSHAQNNGANNRNTWRPQPVARNRGPIAPADDIRHRLRNEPELNEALQSLAELLSNAVTTMHARPAQGGGGGGGGGEGPGQHHRGPQAPAPTWNQAGMPPPGHVHNSQAHMQPPYNPQQGHYAAHQIAQAGTQWGGSFGGQRAAAAPAPQAAAPAPPGFGGPNDQLLARLMQFAQSSHVQAALQQHAQQQQQQQQQHIQGYPPAQPSAGVHYPASVAVAVAGGGEDPSMAPAAPAAHPSVPREWNTNDRAAYNTGPSFAGAPLQPAAPPAGAVLPGSSVPMGQLMASLLAMQANAANQQPPPADPNADGSAGAAGQQ